MNSISVNNFQEIQVVKKKHFLPLTLYFIEKDYGFSGAGFVEREDDLETEIRSSEQKLLAAGWRYASNIEVFAMFPETSEILKIYNIY